MVNSPFLIPGLWKQFNIEKYPTDNEWRQTLKPTFLHYVSWLKRYAFADQAYKSLIFKYAQIKKKFNAAKTLVTLKKKIMFRFPNHAMTDKLWQ